MPLMLRLPLLLGALLVGAPCAHAESPLPDPVPPAVIGRPLSQIKPVRPKPMSTKPTKAAKGKHATARPPAAAKVARAHPHPPQAAPRAVAQEVSVTQRPAKRAVDDRADPRMRLDDVGKGTHFASKPLDAGAYIGDKHRTAVRQYYESHPAPGAAIGWKIGEPLPTGASVAAVPQGLLASLPRLPPGYRYVQLGGEVVMIAAGSRMVVDGVSRAAR